MSPGAGTGARPTRARARVKAEAAKACADTGEEAVELLTEGAWPAKRPGGRKRAAESCRGFARSREGRLSCRGAAAAVATANC